MANEGVQNQSDGSRFRTSSRGTEKEKKKEIMPTVVRNTVGRLDSEAFKRRCRYLREIYLNPEKRHLYDWTNLEKKILMLDWYHNPSYYEEWKPLETEDMMNKFYSNMIYNFNHLSMANVGTTIVFLKLIEEFETLSNAYQCVGMVQRYYRPDSTFYDEFKIGLIWIIDENTDEINGSKVNVFSPPDNQDYQCLLEGVDFNLFTLTDDEFEKLDPCEECQRSQIKQRTTLLTPKILFQLPVTSMEVTSTYLNNNRNYLLAVRTGNMVKMYNITKMISTTTKIIKIWDKVRENYISRFEKKKLNFENKLCTGCLINHEDLKELEVSRSLLHSFTVEEPFEFNGLDSGEYNIKSVIVKRNTYQTGLKFFYTSILDSKVVVPTFLASVGVKRICVWHISSSYIGLKEPDLVMEFSDDSIPTDVSSTLSVVKTFEDLNQKKWVIEPKIYSTDDKGNLRLWTFTKGLECTLKLENNALLTLDVNKRYPHLIAIGGDSGKVKVFNVHVQSMSGEDPGQNLRLLTIPSYLPNSVYQYMNWYHPVVKVKWVNNVFLVSQYSEPFFIRESTNSSTLAIWNPFKDIFDKDDAFLSNKYWSTSMESSNNSYHLASRLLCLYGGHFGSLGGVLSCDVSWSKKFGLLAASSDNTAQLHWYKPGIWAWADSDDPMCLARIKGDIEFHKNVLDIVQREYEVISKESSLLTQGSSNLRKTKSNYTQYLQEAKSLLEEVISGKKLGNDYKSLPNWSKKTLKLTQDEDKYMKNLMKEISEREYAEHNHLQSVVERENHVF